MRRFCGAGGFLAAGFPIRFDNVLPVTVGFMNDTSAARDATGATRETGYVEVDGGRIFWAAVGNGPAVLLIHGGSIDSRMWDGQTAFLADNYRVITYDFRGLGGSPRPTKRYRMSDDALVVLDHLGVASAVVVGFSIGSRIALDLAARVPGRVPAMAIMGVMPWSEDVPESFSVARADLSARLEPRTRAQRRGDLAGAVAADLDVWASAHHGEARAALAEMCMQAPYFYEYREANDEWLGELPPVSDAELASFSSPCLVINGEHDVPLAQLAAERLADVMARADLLVFADADHFVNLGHPTQFNDALREFLDRRRAEGDW